MWNDARSNAKHALVLFLSVTPGLSWTACSGEDATGPTVVEERSVIAEGTFTLRTLDESLERGEECEFVELLEFEAEEPGVLEAIVDWTFEDNDLEIAIMEGRCTCQDVREAPSLEALLEICPPLVGSNGSDDKPEMVSTVTNQTAGTYTLFVANLGDQSDSGSYQVILLQRFAVTD